MPEPNIQRRLLVSDKTQHGSSTSPRLSIHYAPDAPGNYEGEAQQWVNRFKTFAADNGISIVDSRVIDGRIHGNPNANEEDVIRRDTREFTDFMVVYTVDFAAALPDELRTFVENLQKVRQEKPPLMWLATLDKTTSWKHMLKYDNWHELNTIVKMEQFRNLRFPRPRETQDWQDEIASAAAEISSHRSCELRNAKSCPRLLSEQHSPGGDPQPSSGIVASLFNFFRRQSH